MGNEFGSTGQHKVERARSFRRFVRDRRGSTALEFALALVEALGLHDKAAQLATGMLVRR